MIVIQSTGLFSQFWRCF